MKTARELAMEITDGVIALNGEAMNIMDYGTDNFKEVIENAGEVEDITPDDVYPYDWECYCAQLELNPDNTRRIYLLKDMGTVIGHFASYDDCDM